MPSSRRRGHWRTTPSGRRVWVDETEVSYRGSSVADNEVVSTRAVRQTATVTLDVEQDRRADPGVVREAVSTTTGPVDVPGTPGHTTPASGYRRRWGTVRGDIERGLETLRGETFSSSRLAEVTGLNPNTTRREVMELTRAGRLVQVSRGRYQVREPEQDWVDTPGSSAVRRVGYDPSTETLRVEYRNGGTYTFTGVTADAYQELMSAPSLGAQLHRLRRTPRQNQSTEPGVTSGGVRQCGQCGQFTGTDGPHTCPAGNGSYLVAGSPGRMMNVPENLREQVSGDGPVYATFTFPDRHTTRTVRVTRDENGTVNVEPFGEPGSDPADLADMTTVVQAASLGADDPSEFRTALQVTAERGMWHENTDSRTGVWEGSRSEVIEVPDRGVRVVVPPVDSLRARLRWRAVTDPEGNVRLEEASSGDTVMFEATVTDRAGTYNGVFYATGGREPRVRAAEFGNPDADRSARLLEALLAGSHMSSGDTNVRLLSGTDQEHHGDPLTRCPGCGQFAADGHQCPDRTRVYEVGNGASLRCPQLSSVWAAAREMYEWNGSDAEFVATWTDPDGSSVTGTVRASYHPRIGGDGSVDVQVVSSDGGSEHARWLEARVRGALLAEGPNGTGEAAVRNLNAQVAGMTMPPLPRPEPQTGQGAANCPTCGQFAGDDHQCPGPAGFVQRTNRNYRTDLSERLSIPAVTELQAWGRAHRNEPFRFQARHMVGDRRWHTSTMQVTYLGRNRWQVEPVRDTPDGRDRLTAEAVAVLLRARSVREGLAAYQAGSAARVTEGSRLLREGLVGDEPMTVTPTAPAGSAGFRPESSWADDNDGMERFQRAWDAAKARAAAGEPVVPYRRGVSVTGDPTQTFGIELEVENVRDVAAMARAFQAAGLSREARQVGYHADTSRYDMVQVQRDGSLSSTSGAEVVTPILRDTPEDWEKLVRIIEIIEEHGGRATARTGGHLNVGLRRFGNRPSAYANLIGEYKRAEDTVLRLATNPGERVHRNRGSGYSYSNTTPPANGYRTVAQARLANPHGAAIALNNANPDRAHTSRAEFRVFDGVNAPVREGASIRERAEANVGVWQARLAVAVGMVRAADRAANEPDRIGSVTAARNAPEPIGTHRQRFGTRRQEGDGWKDATRAFRSHLDRWIADDETKAQVTALFAVTRYQQVR